MIYLLDKEQIVFPDPREGEEDGLFAVGGDLSTKRLLLAYSNGIFPWYAFRSEDVCDQLLDENGAPYIQWWCPMDRFVIFPDEIHVSHSMRQLLKKGTYNITFNQAFPEVIKNCSDLRIEGRGAWLGEDMIKAYTELFEKGYAASVEVWGPLSQSLSQPLSPLSHVGRGPEDHGPSINGESDNVSENLSTVPTAIGTSAAPTAKDPSTAPTAKGPQPTGSLPTGEGGERGLVGGLYGVCIHGCFFGESMFSLVPSASKVALIALARVFGSNGGKMIDCQFETPHLKTMGGQHISYDEYMEIIKRENNSES